MKKMILKKIGSLDLDKICVASNKIITSVFFTYSRTLKTIKFLFLGMNIR